MQSGPYRLSRISGIWAILSSFLLERVGVNGSHWCRGAIY
jgi:hypothetical protein